MDLTGAKAVAKYFLDLDDHVYATGDLTEWDALSHPECTFCESVKENVEASWAADERTDGGLIEVDNAAAAVVVDRQVYSVDLAIVEKPSRAVSASGEVLSEWSSQQSSTANVLVLCEADHRAIRGVDPDVVK